MRQGAVDLSPQAIEARRRARARGQGDGMTGAQMARAGIAHAQRAMKRRKMAERPGTKLKRARRLADQATLDLITAAAQLRIARRCRLDQPYMHALSMRDIQRVQDAAKAEAGADLGALAVDVHRLAEEARQRLGEEAHDG